MAAEQLIALEAALGELGTLYVAARRFVALRSAAERELLPCTTRLGAALRARLRRGQFDDAAVDAAAREIAAVRADWRARLEAVRQSTVYREAVAAWEAEEADSLRRLLPQVFADVSLRAADGDLFVAVSAAAGRRRPGARPFLAATACAERIAGYRDQGVPSERAGESWWDRELAAVELVDDPDALDSPIALRFDATVLPLPTFRIAESPAFHVFGRLLRAPFTVALQRETDDEWWSAYEESYAAYRDELLGELERLGLPVEIVRRAHRDA